ncbi:FAD-binding oxidoreductase, partial [Phytoactinopolyspora endophytica]|uniref:FAD-binding oxidoreductase n=1 Tax=Phytoactinopolyspora endophytica TaxID=1642495 RepID=UPI00197B2F67
MTAVYRPADLSDAREAVLAARDADTNLIVHGGGTKLGWGGRPNGTTRTPDASTGRGNANSYDGAVSGSGSPAADRAWSVIDTRGLDQLIHHEPGDMTAIVQAGMPLERLQRLLAEAGQQLAVDPPMRRTRTFHSGDRDLGGSGTGVAGDGVVTVGGVYAANDAGPHRFRYGGIRDLVIGSTVVLADGTVSRSGGTVIKNVAGYDLGKLWCGSLGTLGLVVELTVRLHPLPEATRSLLIPASAVAASSFVVDLLASPVECSAIEWSGSMIMNSNRVNSTATVHDHESGALLIEIEGRHAGLGARVDQLNEIVRRHGLSAEPVDGAADVWDAWREAHAGGGSAGLVAAGSGAGVVGFGEESATDPVKDVVTPSIRTVARAATLPSQLADAAQALC